MPLNQSTPYPYMKYLQYQNRGTPAVMMVMIGMNDDYGDDRRAGMICYDLSCTAIGSPLLKPA